VNRQVKKAAGMQGHNKWKAAQEIESLKKTMVLLTKFCTAAVVKYVLFLEWK